MRIVTASSDRSAKVWDAGTGVELFTLGHTSAVDHAAWSSDGTRIVTASDDGNAKVWDAGTGVELFTLSGHIYPVLYVAWNPDDTRIVTAGQDGTAKVWDAQMDTEPFTFSSAGIDDLIEFACTRARRNMTHDEWQRYMGDTVPYRRTCPNLPVSPIPWIP